MSNEKAAGSPSTVSKAAHSISAITGSVAAWRQNAPWPARVNLASLPSVRAAIQLFSSIAASWSNPPASKSAPDMKVHSSAP